MRKGFSLVQKQKALTTRNMLLALPYAENVHVFKYSLIAFT